MKVELVTAMKVELVTAGLVYSTSLDLDAVADAIRTGSLIPVRLSWRKDVAWLNPAAVHLVRCVDGD